MVIEERPGRPEVKEERDRFPRKGCGCGFVAHDEQGYVLPPRNPLQSQARRRRSPPGGGIFLAA